MADGVLHVELVSPERVLLSTDASMVIARTIGGGDIAFLPGHAPFIGALATWIVEIIETAGSRQLAAVHGGFISINDNAVTILSDLAELSEAVDVRRAEAAVERAEGAIRQNTDDAEAVAALARAHARLRAAGTTV